ncbi:MAG: tetratricopeptide repeat protein [Magnetococcales bacterium]|nr:tetratricopeptide repeat protein [Magnetococcales bacterium]
MAGNAKSKAAIQKHEDQSLKPSGLFSGLRAYVHDLINMRSLHNELNDRNMLEGDDSTVSISQRDVIPLDVIPLDVNRIKEIISNEENQSDQQPIYLSGLIPQTHVGDVDSVVSGRNGASLELIDAERHLFRAIDEYESAFSEDSYPLVDILFRFAKLFVNQGNQERGLSYLQKAWSLANSAGQTNNLITGLVLVLLVETAHRCEELYESDKGFYALLELTEQRGDIQVPELAKALNGLANYFVSCSEYNKATLIFDRALNVFFINNQEDHAEYINILNSAGSMYYGLQMFEEAQKLYELAIKSIEVNKLYDDSNTPILYHNSGLVCCHINLLPESRVLLVRSLITALQNGQEWVLWKACYSLSYLFIQENKLAGAIFFGKLATAITLQSWQSDPNQSQSNKIMDQFLIEHMENLFLMNDKEYEWEQIKEIIKYHADEQSEAHIEDSLQFFSGEEKNQFQLFLLLSLQVKQIPMSALNDNKGSIAENTQSAGRKLEELEADFLQLLAKWDVKKIGRLFLG